VFVCVVSKDLIVPKEATIIIFSLRAHRLEEHWDNPDVFNPDNHLPEKAAERNLYSFIPFSAGPRSCIGKHEFHYEINIQHVILPLYYWNMKMDKFAISDFIFKLSSESWEGVFNNNDVNLMFNYFLNTYLNIFHSSFPIVRSTTKNYVNNWITPGIKTSCKSKRELFLLTKTSNDSAMKRYYKAYCKVLTNVIREAKRI
jgi:hypothetical protein